MEKIGYRFPFAFLGVKGGTGHLLMDKTEFLLRIDAALGANGAISSSGPGTYPRASRKAPPATFADESYGSPKYTSA